MPAQVAFARAAAPEHGLRERKKVKTRLAIEDAALALFEEQGYEETTVEEIAARAEISTTTFVRYFPTKAEVVLSDHGEQLPALHDSILERPSSESDLVALWRSVRTDWLGAVDPERTARKANLVASSDALSGRSFHRGHQWLAVITDALAVRQGREPGDERASLAARVGLEALGSAVERWIAGGCAGDLGDAIDESFKLMVDVCGELAGESPTDVGQYSCEASSRSPRRPGGTP
jgi:AcrR family transcriptional regulator